LHLHEGLTADRRVGAAAGGHEQDLADVEGDAIVGEHAAETGLRIGALRVEGEAAHAADREAAQHAGVERGLDAAQASDLLRDDPRGQVGGEEVAARPPCEAGVEPDARAAEDGDGRTREVHDLVEAVADHVQPVDLAGRLVHLADDVEEGSVLRKEQTAQVRRDAQSRAAPVGDHGEARLREDDAVRNVHVQRRARGRRRGGLRRDRHPEEQDGGRKEQPEGAEPGGGCGEHLVRGGEPTSLSPGSRRSQAETAASRHGGAGACQRNWGRATSPPWMVRRASFCETSDRTRRSIAR
jgi:hypothetical protein